MQKNYYVYCHTNKINNKKYIGITIQNPERRWRANGQGYKGQSFYNAIKKYGWDAFIHEIIASELTEIEAKLLEQQLIEKFKTTNSKYGYNTSIGGESNLKYDSVEAREEAIAETKRKSAQKRYADPAKLPAIKASQKKYKDIRKLDPIKHKADLQAARISGKKCNEKVKEIRQCLRDLYNQNPILFSVEDYELAFKFKADKKSYICSSTKKLQAILDRITKNN